MREALVRCKNVKRLVVRSRYSENSAVYGLPTTDYDFRFARHYSLAAVGVFFAVGGSMPFRRRYIAAWL
jgi:hypothetical protein